MLTATGRETANMQDRPGAANHRYLLWALRLIMMSACDMLPVSY